MDRSSAWMGAGAAPGWQPSRPEPAAPPVAESLRQVMRRVPAAVTVVTATVDGKPMGMTATSFTTLSLDPASVIVAVHRQASIHDGLQRHRHFAVNILGPVGERAAQAFAAKELTQAQRFAGVAWHRDPRGLPVLEQALATLACEIAERVVHGTHLLLVGNVVEVASRGDGTALLYAEGGFHRLGA